MEQVSIGEMRHLSSEKAVPFCDIPRNLKKQSARCTIEAKKGERGREGKRWKRRHDI
jgi:hypothetical protein